MSHGHCIVHWAPRLAVAIACAYALAPALAANESASQADVQEVARLIAVDAVGKAMVDYCAAKAPGVAPKVRSAWIDWRIAQGVDEAHDRLERLQRKRTAVPQEMNAQIAARMAQQGAPEQVCAGLATDWSNTPALDLRQLQPKAYDAQGRVIALQPPSEFSTEPPYTRRPTGTVLNVAQLCALLKQEGERRRKAGARKGLPLTPELAGRVFVRGRVKADGENVYLEHDEGPYRAVCRVGLHTALKDNRLRDYDGHDLVASGAMPEEFPSYADWMIDLQYLRLVPDPAALIGSKLAYQDRLRRKPADLAKLRTAPGRGLPPQAVEGILFDASMEPDGNGGYRPRDRIMLLLKDGSVHTSPEIPPEDFALAASRELEPQHWGEWRRAAGGYEVRHRNDLGQLESEWTRVDGRLAKPWGTQQRIAGSFIKAAFYGSAALGGTYSKSTVVFGTDGTYEGLQFTQSGSGSMAALNGFSSSATTVASGEGTSTSVGGGTENVTVVNRSQRDDGADRRGGYTLNGYTLEVRYDSGRMARVISFPTDDKVSGVWVDGTVFIRPSK